MGIREELLKSDAVNAYMELGGNGNYAIDEILALFKSMVREAKPWKLHNINGSDVWNETIDQYEHAILEKLGEKV